jgi:phosphoribosylformimino-5-aminoimidazole carboxamide ribotide isomerase
VIVIPAVDIRGGRVVRLVRGDPERATEYSDDPVAAARRFEEQRAPWIHLVDLDAAFGTGNNTQLVGAACRAVGVPVQVGGGLRSLGAVDEAISSGAARAILGTAAAWDPELVAAAVARHGERVAVAIDAQDGMTRVRAWNDVGPPIDELIPLLDRAGAPRFIVTSVGSDGTMSGPDISLYEHFRTLTDRPVVASGGIRNVQDLRVLSDLGVEGAVVGRAVHEGTLLLEEALAEVGT